jgi:hypothetical protein
MKQYLFSVVILVIFASCFKKSTSDSLLVDYDTQKIVNKDVSFVIFDPAAHSGTYVSFADSISPYSSGIISNLKLLLKGKKAMKINVSAFVKKFKQDAKANIAFRLIDKSGAILIDQQIYIDNNSVPNVNEWTNILGSFNIPSGENFYSSENSLYIFLYSVKDKILIDDLEVTSE